MEDIPDLGFPHANGAKWLSCFVTKKEKKEESLVLLTNVVMMSSIYLK